MLDITMILLLAVVFVLLVGFTRWCSKIEDGGESS